MEHPIDTIPLTFTAERDVRSHASSYEPMYRFGMIRLITILLDSTAQKLGGVFLYKAAIDSRSWNSDEQIFAHSKISTTTPLAETGDHSRNDSKLDILSTLQSASSLLRPQLSQPQLSLFPTVIAVSF